MRSIRDGGPTVWPPPWTIEELTTAGISEDGKRVQGWVVLPSPLWVPDQDLLVRPPGTKAHDMSKIGDVDTFTALPDKAWVQAQLDKSAAYWAMVRRRIAEGTFTMTAAVRRLLGLDDEDDHIGLLPKHPTTKIVTDDEAAEAIADYREIERLTRVH